MVVMPHVSMRAVGTVDGGADTLIDALLEVVGTQGTLFMVIAADEDDPFDAGLTEVDVEEMGVLAEVFRRRPESVVNDHPACRCAAIGPRSDELLNPAPLHDYFGPGSPIERVAHHGYVLRLGADIDTTTMTHYAEYVAEISDKKRVERRYFRADSGEVMIGSLDDSLGIRTWDGGDYFSQIMHEFLQTRSVRIGRVGECDAELFEGAVFVRFAVEWLERVFG